MLETFRVTSPVSPPPDRPVPAVTLVISPTSVVYPFDSIRSLIAALVIRVVSLSAKDSPEVVNDAAASSLTVRSSIFIVIDPVVEFDTRPVPAVRDVTLFEALSRAIFSTTSMSPSLTAKPKAKELLPEI